MQAAHLLPRDGSYGGLSPHRSTAGDRLTPLNPDGTCCALRDAWRYLLTARGAGHDDAELNEIASGGDR